MARLSGGSGSSKSSGSSKNVSYGLSGKNTGISLPSKSGSSSSNSSSSSSGSGLRLPSSSGSSGAKVSGGSSSSGLRLPSSSSSSGTKVSGGSSSSGLRLPSSSGSSGAKLSGGSSSSGLRLPSSSGSSGAKLSGGSSGSGLRLPSASSGALSKPNSGYTVKQNVLSAYTTKPGAAGAQTSAGNLSGKNITGYKDSLQSKIPRRENPNGFQAIRTPNSNGSIKSYHGGKMKDGVIYYPDGVEVDFGMAARNQAFVDYSYGENTSGSAAMGKIYGDAYYNELQRLDDLPVGAPAWGTKGGTSGKGSSTNRSDREYGYGSGSDDALMDEYRAILEAAQRASQEAILQQTQQGLNSIYAQKDPLAQNYKDAAQQAYIAQMMGYKAMPQQMAAQGLTGGATESANVAIETLYGNGLNDLTNTYQKGLAQIDLDAANFQATGGISQAENAATYQQMLAQAYLEMQLRAQQLQSQKELAAYNARLNR